MKKLFLILAFLSMFIGTEAKADLAPAPCFPFGCGALGAAGGGASLAFDIGFVAFAVLPAVIIEMQPVDPWHKVFPVVDQSFPQDKHFPVPTTVVSNNGFGKPYRVIVNGQESIRSDGY